MANAKENVQVVQEVEASEAVLPLQLTRTPFTGRDKKEYWSYAINGKIRGKDVKVDFVAFDQGGYEMLDLIFSIRETADLVVTDGTMKNEDTGEIIKFRTYEAVNVDESGIEYRYKIKPARESDKAQLNVLLQLNQLAQAKTK